LQKINILRDVARDLASNRYFWPKKLLEKYNLNYKTLCNRENRELAVKVLSKQINNVRRYLYSAIKYVLNLPKNALRVRMFCLIPLFMAIESYVKCINDYGIFEIEKIVKIEREKVYEIVFKSKLWGNDNEKIFKWFLQAVVKISPDFVREEYIRSIRPYIN
jgi:farnesyl-diphosphate farnesyltransferase